MTVEAAAGRSHQSRSQEETLLLRRAAAGEVDAFDALLAPRLDRLFRLAVAITRSEADARDAVQDACVLAWREVPRLRDHARFDAWLSQITVNACRGILRRRRRTNGREVELDLGGVPFESRHASQRSAAIENLGEQQAIQRAFERLEPLERSLIILHYVEERPLAEIGGLLRAPVGTIKWRLSNARKALIRALEVEAR